MMELNDKIDPKHTALVVVDIQNDFASPDPKFFRASRGGDLSQVDPMVDRLNTIIPIAEKAGVLVLYTQQIYDPSKLNSLQVEQYTVDGKLITCDIAGDGYKFYRINPPQDKIFVKHNYNIFSNIELIAMLEKNNIKTLVITGMDTSICVETAVRNGFDLGYKIVLAQDMVAANAKSRDLNEKTLEIVKKTFGVLSTCQELQDIWER